MRILWLVPLMLLVSAVLIALQIPIAPAPPATTKTAALLEVSTQAEIVIKAPVFPTFIRTETVDGAWRSCWARILAEATRTPDYLYILWEDREGIVHLKVFDVGRTFTLAIQDGAWVRDTALLDNGSAVLGVTHRDIKVYREVPLSTAPVP